MSFGGWLKKPFFLNDRLLPSGGCSYELNLVGPDISGMRSPLGLLGRIQLLGWQSCPRKTHLSLTLSRQRNIPIGFVLPKVNAHGLVFVDGPLLRVSGRWSGT